MDLPADENIPRGVIAARTFDKDFGELVFRAGAAVVGLLVDGLTAFEVRQRIPELTEEDIAACIEFSAAQLHEASEREALLAEMRRRIAEDEAHPEDGIPAEQVIADLRRLDEASAGSTEPEEG